MNLKTEGFTLIEMAITLTILCTMTMLVAPSFTDWLARNRQRNLAHALANAIRLTQSEALKRNHRVNLCTSRDQKTCTAGGWEHGWLIYPDIRGDNTLDTRDAPILHVEAGPFDRVTARGNRPVARYISFINLGRPQRFDGSLQMGTVTVCTPGQNAINVVMAHSGRVSMQYSKTPCP